MGFAAKILADSISPDGVRLTTMEITFPRIILAEFNTHRMFSRNSASSRAIPVEKMIARVMEAPYIPTSWGKNQKGMQAERELDEDEQLRARNLWLDARLAAVVKAEELRKVGLHKQLTNRLLEPFMWHTCIVTATEWSNFFHLRNNPQAHPDIKTIAEMMQEMYEKSREDAVEQVPYGAWHYPLLNSSELDAARSAEREHLKPAMERWRKISVARCARVSYLTHDGKRDTEADIDLYDRLLASGHLSPFEHVARPATENDDVFMMCLANEYNRSGAGQWWSGNFRGWVQLRKTIANEQDILGSR